MGVTDRGSHRGMAGAPRQPVTGPAPGRLEHVRAFVNTLDIEARTDELSSPGARTRGLRARDLIGPQQGQATEDDLRQAIATREALREVLLAHVGQQLPAGAPVGILRSVAASLATRLDIGDDGSARPVPDGPAGTAGLGSLLLIAAEAAALGTWPRLKGCSADDCKWAFSDRSPTKSGRWCRMAGLGPPATCPAHRHAAAAGAAA